MLVTNHPTTHRITAHRITVHRITVHRQAIIHPTIIRLYQGVIIKSPLQKSLFQMLGKLSLLGKSLQNMIKKTNPLL